MKQYNILIVDDEERFANILARRLSLRGCVCEVSYSGQEALDKIKRKNFFLILLDLHLPDIYGIEVLTQIKKFGSKTPIIILTGHGNEEDRRQCMQMGAYDFIHKPLGIETLVNLLEEIRKRRA